MSKPSIDSKEFKGKTYYTSAYLRKKLYLSSDRARAIMLNYENDPDLGTNPKFYSEDVIDKIINDYYSDDVKFRTLEKRKEKAELKRAEEERRDYDKSELLSDEDAVDWFLTTKRVEKELVPTMLKNLFSALGKEFDMETFYNDIMKVEKYKRVVGDYGIPRPLDIVEAEERLLSNDGYLK
ncbi:hypothetical protein [Streptococcus sp. E24BD]|uniref:hypothetical protein n=1 Tax=Streptococcus sp. E24BD TaxID=3278715 RepID=UPI00359E351E